MKIKSLIIKIFILIKEKKYNKRLKYLYFNNNSNTLVVGFSGMSKTPSYNYVKTLRNIHVDKLFLLDDFANKGSYHWFSNGDGYPEDYTTGVIEYYLNKKRANGGGIKT